MTDALQGAAADLMPGPTTPADTARAKIAELKADPDFVKRHLSGDLNTREELTRLHELAYTPAEGSISMGGPTPAAVRAEMADHLSTLSDLPAAVIEQIKSGAPVSADEFRLAVGRKNALMGDPAWVAKYMKNDATAQRDMLLLNVILSSPIKLRA